jgi:hypothetical protein
VGGVLVSGLARGGDPSAARWAVPAVWGACAALAYPLAIRGR